MKNRSSHGQLEYFLSFYAMAFVLLVVATLCLTASPSYSGETKAPTFSKAQVYEALNMVEASGKKRSVPTGANGRAIGPLQIHKSYWTDAIELNERVNNRFGLAGSEYKQCERWEYSKRIVNVYMTRYATDAWSGNMQLRDVLTVARIHNGGPRGNGKEATKKYADKVIRILMADWK